MKTKNSKKLEGQWERSKQDPAIGSDLKEDNAVHTAHDHAALLFVPCRAAGNRGDARGHWKCAQHRTILCEEEENKLIL